MNKLVTQQFLFIF